MGTVVQFRRDTAANWASVNPTLAEGELGLETDTMAYKIGNGATAWTSLGYRGLAPELASALFAGVSSEPSAPAASKLLVYSKDVAGRMMLKQKGPSGLDTQLQPALFSNGIQILAPASSTAFSVFGQPAPTAVGTVSHPAIASGSLRAQTRRAIITSAATANSASELRNALLTIWRGDAAGQGGFFFTARFGISSATALQRMFVGLTNSSGALATTLSPSTLTNCLGVSFDSNVDTNLQMLNNDGSGTAVKTDLGSGFPVASSTDAVYELIIFAKPNDSVVSWRMMRLDTGAVATGTFSSDMPSAGTFLAWHLYANNGGTAAAVILDVYRVYVETDY